MTPDLLCSSFVDVGPYGCLVGSEGVKLGAEVRYLNCESAGLFLSNRLANVRRCPGEVDAVSPRECRIVIGDPGMIPVVLPHVKELKTRVAGDGVWEIKFRA